MKKLLYIFTFLLIFFPGFLLAQIGKVGVNTSTPAAMLHVKDSSVLFTGVSPLPVTPGAPPASGPGTRMMWYPDKAAFRAGAVTGTHWNKDSIGQYSFASGFNNKVKGAYSASFGVNNEVTGTSSLALGQGQEIHGSGALALGLDTYAGGLGTFATGFNAGGSGSGSVTAAHYSSNHSDYSMMCGSFNNLFEDYSLCGGQNNDVFGLNALCVGSFNTCSGDNSIVLGEASQSLGNNTLAGGANCNAGGDNSISFGNNNSSSFNAAALGDNTVASGHNSLATGYFTEADSYAMIAGGRFNEEIGSSMNLWIASDPLFVLGNGSSENSRHNAFTVLKTGHTGINTSSPNALLHVVRDGTDNNPYNVFSAAIFEGETGSFIQLSNNNTTQSGILSGNENTEIRSALIFNQDSSVAIRTGGNTTRAFFNKTGQVGIGDATPNAKLHVSDGTGGNLYHSNAELIIEDNDASYLQFSSLANEEAGILSGNTLTSLRSALIFRADSSVQVRAGGGTTRLAILKNGNIGINTLSPQRLWHVANGSSGASSPASAVAVVESSGDAALSLLTPNAEESAVYFGNPANSTHGGIVYNSTVANGLAFRTNGNSTKMVISDAGDVGIGDNSPNARLHVSSGTANATYNSNSSFILEDNATVYMQLASPAANENGILSSTDAISIRAAIMFRVDSAVEIRSGGNTTRMYISKTGNIGIGTTNPTQKLNVVGNGLFTGTVTASCGVLSCSDRRYKKNIEPIKSTLGQVSALEPVYYDWDQENYPEKDFTGERQLGIIAQDLEQQFPELVHTDEAGFKTVDYSRLSVVLLKALQEQGEEIEKLKEEMRKMREMR